MRARRPLAGLGEPFGRLPCQPGTTCRWQSAAARPARPASPAGVGDHAAGMKASTGSRRQACTRSPRTEQAAAAPRRRCPGGRWPGASKASSLVSTATCTSTSGWVAARDFPVPAATGVPGRRWTPPDARGRHALTIWRWTACSRSSASASSRRARSISRLPAAVGVAPAAVRCSRRAPEACFQLRHVQRHRRRRQVQRLGGRREGAEVSHGEQRAKAVEVEFAHGQVAYSGFLNA
jgi:hypothetical protein